jgi:hypothetical protein
MYQFKIEADAQGEILRFRDAVLARVETNLNMDDISEENLQEAAAGLPLLPIDLEHKETIIVGMFTDATVKNKSLITSGIIYASRFPKVVEGFVNETNFLSIEGLAQQTSCPVCNKVYASRADYCEHLTASVFVRRKNGWKRKLHGFIPRGGGITSRPAGSRTVFNTRKMSIIASEETETAEVIFLRELNYKLQKYGYKIVEV